MRGEWTEEQLDAVNARGKNLLVSAAAGSGKTAVLIERIIRLITEPNSNVDIDRLLVVTFTKAAAAEMKGRLRARLIEMQSKDRTNAVLQRQLVLLPGAPISTFDSLCQRIVRENFTKLDIDPLFKVGDDAELLLLREQALDDIFEDSYKDSEAFRELVEAVCETADDYQLRNAVLMVFNYIQSERTPFKWLSDKAEEYNISSDINDTGFGRDASSYAIDELHAAIFSLKKGLSFVNAPGGPIEYSDNFLAEIEMLENVLMSDNYTDMAVRLKSVISESLPRVKLVGDMDAEIKDKAQKYRNNAKKLIDDIKKKYFSKSIDGLLTDIKNAYPLLKTLSETVALFSERFMELKKENKILSFSDIKLLCYSVLVVDGKPTAEAESYKKLFEYVLVDEYQDTNDVEEGILDAISGNSNGVMNRFMVGDVKQSIYRFRQSKPALFIEKSERYGHGEDGGRLITLSRNFRSKGHILDGINFIFSRIMTRSAAEIEYDGSQRLIKGTVSDEGTGIIEIALIETDLPEITPDGGEDEEEFLAISEMKSLEVEAGFIADKIYELTDCGNYRFSDIVILMRSGKQNGALVSSILADKGITCITEGRTGYFELTEISDMLALLQIIDNPLQDIPLIATLTSPVFKFTADELIEIRNINKDGYFYNALAEYAVQSTEASFKARAFLDKLSEYRRLATNLPADELLTYLYDDTGYFIMAGAMENGRQRQANLRNLAKRASDFEKSDKPGLFHFVRHMERLKERDMLRQPEAGEDENAVRIITIHKSKGLEFPVVFVAGCGGAFNLRDLNAQLILHQELGYGASFIDYAMRTRAATLPKNVVKERLRRETLAEEMRLLYVALTRAKEKLFITGGAGKDTARAIGKWIAAAADGEQVSRHAVLSARSYMDWIMPAVLGSPCIDNFLAQYGLSVSHSAEAYGENASFSAHVVKRSEAPAKGQSEKNDGIGSRELFNSKIAAIMENNQHPYFDIDKLINWKYNYEAEITMPVKLSVSEIKMQYQRLIAGEAETGLLDISPQETEGILEKPQFMQEKKGLSASERGTAVHTVLADLELINVKSETDIRNIMDRLLKKKLLSLKEYEAINISEILEFTRSNTAERIRLSKNVRREVPFVIGLSAEDVFLPKSNEDVLVHGIIDCFFEEDGKIIIVDYKTDYVQNGDFDAVKQKYKIQIEVYRRAAGKITQKPVSEVYLYMLRYGRLISLHGSAENCGSSNEKIIKTDDFSLRSR